ncbi:MAG: hypothetical protein ACRELY_21880 [Polyangiaceae bacterium]
MRRIVRFAMVISMLSATACGGGGTSNGGSTGSESSSLAGSWTGSWRSNSGVGGGVTFAITQDGNNLTGTASMTGSVCLENAKITGLVDGDDVHIDVTAGDTKASTHLTITGNNQIDGTYDALSAGICSGDTGTITANR